MEVLNKEILISEIQRNVHILNVPDFQKSIKLLMLSDVHWDNPKCHRNLLKKHLDEAKEEGCRVMINGDLFCLMQGKGDPRKSKDDILPEHNNSRYLDSIVKTSADWFAPYAEIIDVVGYGNHETSIIKHQETDILERFVERLNTIANPVNKVHLGGYGGWIVVRFKLSKEGNTRAYKIKYNHGFGGGGPVTKGTIQHNRFATYIEGADCIWQGHVHEDYELTYSKEVLDGAFKTKHKDVLMLRTSSYKEEYKDGFGGFHVEKGRPVKPLGGRWLEIYVKKEDNNYVTKGYTYRTKN